MVESAKAIEKAEQTDIERHIEGYVNTILHNCSTEVNKSEWEALEFLDIYRLGQTIHFAINESINVFPLTSSRRYPKHNAEVAESLFGKFDPAVVSVEQVSIILDGRRVILNVQSLVNYIVTPFINSDGWKNNINSIDFLFPSGWEIPESEVLYYAYLSLGVAMEGKSIKRSEILLMDQKHRTILLDKLELETNTRLAEANKFGLIKRNLEVLRINNSKRLIESSYLHTSSNLYITEGMEIIKRTLAWIQSQHISS